MARDDFIPSDEEDTSGEHPALHSVSRESLQAVLVAMRALLQEMKTLGRKVETVTVTVNNHATANAVIAVKQDATEKLTASLSARVEALEDERAELAKAILAKAAVLAGGLGTLIAALFAYYTKGTP